MRCMRKRKPQETQALALASSQSWLPLLRPSIPIGWSLRLLRERRSELESTRKNVTRLSSMTSQGQTAVNNYVKQLSVRFMFLLDSRDVIRTRVKCMHVVKE